MTRRFATSLGVLLVATLATGCADNNTSAQPGQRFDQGVDGAGGQGGGAPSTCTDIDRDGYGDGVDCRGPDCDDSDNTVNPGAAEVCDGADNDCNGAVDDNLFGPDCAQTRGVCAGSRQKCADGEWAMCGGVASFGAEYEADETACDSLDNDCDGRTDEGCPCAPGSTQPCGSAEGECRQGTQGCASGQWGACADEVGPADEACDGRDNNCDGTIDEGVDAVAPDCALSEGVCAGARKTCAGAGGWSTCGAAEYGERWVAEEGPTHCDGVDNDCDGLTDEECDCDDGDTQPCGIDVGACAPGTQTCAGGRFSECRGAVEPRDEACDGRDNDCDGSLDEGLVAPNCARQQGVCAGSTQVCGGPAGFTLCDAARYRATDERYVEDETDEHCDGLDNDCDGTIDEACLCQDGAVQPCGDNVGQCTQGEQTCVAGRFGECSGHGPSSEVCDGVDNDCDGAADEGVTGPACDRQEGLCGGSQRRCVNGAFAACGPEEFGPLYQVNETFCDTRDNDCDGLTDEGCQCVDNQTQRCGTDVGACTRGTQICVGGRFGACEGAVEPVAEACDGVDNDCDEGVDEDLVAPACLLQVGVCAGASQRCGGDAGWIAACGADEYGPLWAAVETDAHCDGRDNDCDGMIDEGCECQPDGDPPVCGTSTGECQTGRLQCENGHFTVCEGEVPAGAEACDGLDNDCDGNADEALVGPACVLQTGVCAGSTRQCGGELGFVDCVNEEYGPFYRQAEGDGDCDGRDNDCDGLFDEACPFPAVVISEVFYDGPGRDGPTEFIELAGPAGTWLSGMVIEAVNGSTGEVYGRIRLPRVQMPFNGYYLIVGTGATDTLRDIADQVHADADLQNGPDSVRLNWNDLTIDALAYGVFGEGETAAGEGAPAAGVAEDSLSRDATNTDTDDNATDFLPGGQRAAGGPTPGGDPLPRVHVALRWDVDETDFDLHFIRTGGAYNSSDDVYFGNRRAAWPDQAAGDPRLDRDDTDGLGPEFVDFVRPLPGRYLVEVTYWSATINADGAPPSTATLGIFVDDQEALALTGLMGGENPFWAAAEVIVDDAGGIRVAARDEYGLMPFDNLAQP